MLRSNSLQKLSKFRFKSLRYTNVSKGKETLLNQRKTTKNNKDMYRLQWTKIVEDGKMIKPEDFVYHDTVFEYEDRDEALHDRSLLMQQVKDKYIRVVEVE